MVKNEMIERALKALEQAEPKFGGPHTFTFSTPDTIRAQRLAMVRAVIEAMLEPTDEMVEAAVSEFTSQSGNWGPKTTPQTIQREVFRRAIDAALNPEESEDETNE